MNSLKFLLVNFIHVHALTLNERRMPATLSAAQSRNKLQMGHVNIEEALTQLRAAVETEKLDSTQDNTRLSHVLENSSYAEADAVKSLIFSSVSRKSTEAENDSKTSPKYTRDSKNKFVGKSRKDGKKGGPEAAWAQSGGGCHSSVGQEAFASALKLCVASLVKEIAQGRQITNDAFAGCRFASYHTTSSGGSWMWTSFLAGHYANAKGQNFQKRIGWIDAVVIPNVDRANWKEAMLHAAGVGKKSPVMKSVGDEGLETYEAMITNSLHFYLKVRQDPSLAHMPMQDIVKADLAAQAMNGDAEVQKIAAQYGVDTTQSGLLSTVKKVAKKFPHAGTKTRLARGEKGISGECNFLADEPTCTQEDLIAMFGTSYTCVKSLALEAPSAGGWTETVWTKFLAPFDVAKPSKLGDIGYEAPEMWLIHSTKALKPFPSANTSLSDQMSSGGILADEGTPIVPAVSASSNFGLSLYYLLYYTKSPQGYNCGPNVQGAVRFFMERNMSQKLWKEAGEFVEEFLDRPGEIMTEKALELAADLSAIASGGVDSIGFWDISRDSLESDSIYFDGMSSDNTAFAALLGLLSPKVEAFPTVLVTSTGSEDFDFMAVMSFFLPQIPVKWAPPGFDVVLPMEYLCEGDAAEITTENNNYLLEKENYECLHYADCPQDLFKFGIPCEGADPNTDNFYSKIKKTGILYLEDVDVLENSYWGITTQFKLEALSFALSIQTEGSFTWLHAFFESAIPDDIYLDQFPTFPPATLMSIPVRYAFLMNQYYQNMATKMAHCFRESSKSFVAEFMAREFSGGCAIIYCKFTKEYVFPLVER